MNEKVTIEKKVFDVLQKNNLDLMEKLGKAKEVLRFYAEQKHIITKNTDDANEPNALWVKGFVEDGANAQDCLKEIEK